MTLTSDPLVRELAGAVCKRRFASLHGTGRWEKAQPAVLEPMVESYELDTQLIVGMLRDCGLLREAAEREPAP